MEEMEEMQDVSEQFEEPEIETKPGFIVVGFKYHGRNPQNAIRGLWRRLHSRARNVSYKVNSDETYGIMGPIDTRTGEFDYLIGYEVKKVGRISKDMEKWEVPEQTYAVIPCTDDQLAETVDYIYNYWMTESEYQRAEGPEFVFYGEDYDREDEESQLLLHVPVVEA